MGLSMPGNGAILVTRSTSGTIGLGDGTAQLFEITQSEIASMLAGSLIIGEPAEVENNSIIIVVADVDTDVVDCRNGATQRAWFC